MDQKNLSSQKTLAKQRKPAKALRTMLQKRWGIRELGKKRAIRPVSN